MGYLYYKDRPTSFGMIIRAIKQRTSPLTSSLTFNISYLGVSPLKGGSGNSITFGLGGLKYLQIRRLYTYTNSY